MYWLRSFTDLPFLALQSLAWIVGGWLIVAGVFRIRPAERLLSGLATGFLLFISLSNLLAQVLPLSLAFWAAAGLILAAGLVLVTRRWAGHWQVLCLDWRAYPQLIGLGLLTLLFVLVGRGLALFDDYLHIPLVSVMASGDIPPHFYLNPPEHFAYHYGLQVWAASLVRAGGFFPWSAWDLSKALAIALTLMLSWLWVRRVTRSRLAAGLGSFLITFAGGARGLLLLLPLPALRRISAGVQLSNSALDSGPDLLTVLSRPWLADGSGPFPFLFAFHNGIFVPVMFSLGSSGAMPFLTLVLLLLLLGRRRLSYPAALVLGLVFATLALSAEHIFVFAWGGIGLAGLIYVLNTVWRRRTIPWAALLPWIVFLGLSALLSVVQGAFITEAVRNLWLSLQGIRSETGGTYNYFEFAPRWPPAMDSAHFGALSWLDPAQLVVLLAELGPTLLLAPAVTLLTWRRLHRRDGWLAGLGLAALVSIVIATFFRYGVERSATRLPAFSLWIWTLLGFPLAWRAFQQAGSIRRSLYLGLYIVTVLGGVMTLAVALISVPFPQLTYFMDAKDARLSQQYWDRLPPQAQVLDAIATRSVALFGRATRSSVDFYHPLPVWEQLMAAPDPSVFARAGYDYLYVDRKWWQGLTVQQQQALQGQCVRTLAALNPADGDFRWLLDMSACR